MDIYLNDQKADITLDNEKIIGDVLNGIQIECEKADATIFAISINDKQISAEELDQACKIEISEVSKLNITTVSKDDIKNAFKQISLSIPELSDNLSQVSVNLQTGKDALVNETVKSFADFFDNFCHIVSLSALFPEDFSNMTIVDKNISDFLSDFGPILSDFENAYQEKDTVLIGDLAEYEILPRIEEIKIFCNSI